jgi:hypothetical protein
MIQLEECLGRITRPLEACKTCKKDEFNLNCPCYQPHKQIELIDVGEVDRDEYGEQGRIYNEQDRRA